MPGTISAPEAGVVPIARIVRPRFYTDPSTLACSLFTEGWSAWFPTARVPSTPTCFSRAAWLIFDYTRRTSIFLSCAFRQQEDDQAGGYPSLRASDEHILIVRVPRAKRVPRRPRLPS